MASRLSVGKKYDNFESLKEDLNLFEKETFVNLRNHDSHLLATLKSKNKFLNYKDELLYKDVTYICKHGGLYKSHRVITGERPKQMASHLAKFGSSDYNDNPHNPSEWTTTTEIYSLFNCSTDSHVKSC